MLNINELKKIISYDKNTGIFTWKVFRSGKAKPGSIAGSIDSKGYIQIKLYKKLYLAHRLAWFYENGEFPVLNIDHIDRNPKNNSIKNLRLCTHKENHQNINLRKTNTSGYQGISFNKKSGKWLAYISKDNKRIRLGLFEKLEEAVVCRMEAKKKYHDFNPY